MIGSYAAAALGYFLFLQRLSDVYLSIVTLAVTLIIYTVLASTAGPEYHIGEAQLAGFNGIPGLPGIAFPRLDAHQQTANYRSDSYWIFAIVFRRERFTFGLSVCSCEARSDCRSKACVRTNCGWSFSDTISGG